VSFKKKVLGRGLSALLPDPEPAAVPREQASDVPGASLDPNPFQPRSVVDAERLASLAASIRESGIVQPILVRRVGERYQIIAGERRWRAAQQAGLAEVPALVRDQEDAERLQVALIENMAREDLNAVDEARACATLVEDLGVSKEELARRLGRSRAAVSNLIRLLDLPDEALELLRSGELTEGHGRAILQARGAEARRRLARAAASGGWSVRETERRAKQAGAKGRGSRPRRDADLDAALADAEEELERALGHDASVRAGRGGVKAELVFEDLDELRSFARRVRRR
jgi:ParB family transcriptional regulator, chromosome partitioning protein